jgi:hypothetical protein
MSSAIDLQLTGVLSLHAQCFNDVEGLLYARPDAGFVSLPNGTLAPGRYMFEVSVYKEPFFAPLTREPLNRQVQHSLLAPLFPHPRPVQVCT